MKKKLNELFDCNYDIEINGVKTSSRDVKPGDLFVCIMGASVDRHEYADDAIKNGAVALVVSRLLDIDVPQILVNNTNDELPKIVAKFYDYPQNKLKLIAVTGTDGKTSTSTIIYQLLNNYKKTGYIGTNGVVCPTYTGKSGNTTPPIEQLLPIFNEFINNNCEYVSMEAASEGLAQKRCEGIEFDVSIFTNLTHEHLNFHKTMDNYFEAKKILFDQTKKDGYSIINIDDEYGKKLTALCKNKVYTYGSCDNSDFYFHNVEISANKTVFDLSFSGNTYHIVSPLLGLFNVYNLTAALAALYCVGVDLNDVITKMSNLVVDGRMISIDEGQDFHAIVDYAHTPNGYLKLFEFLNTVKKNRTIIVAGSAGERDHDKRPIMGKILVENSDYVIFTYEDPRTEDPNDIIDDLTRDVMDKTHKFKRIVDRHDAIVYAINMAKKGDLVLVLGKGNETYETIGREKIYFNDIEEVHTALKNLLQPVK